MKSLGKKAASLRLERMRASPRWTGESFRNVHPTLPGLRYPLVATLAMSEFLCGGNRRIPRLPMTIAIDPSVTQIP